MSNACTGRNINRRSFIRGAGLAAASVAAVSGTAIQARADEAGDEVEAPRPAYHTWEVKPDPIPADQIVETIECDILVVGAGISGLAAAEAASADGAKVVVVEQSTANTSHGSDNGAIGTRVQEELGLHIDADRICRMIYQWNQQATDFNLLKVWADRSGEVYNHFFDLADEIGLHYGFALCPTSKTDWWDLDYPFAVYPTACSFSDLTWDESAGGVLAQKTLTDMLQAKAEERGAEFRFSTRARQLLREEGEDAPVTGAVCSLEDGSYIQVNASKGVILATGAISGNEEMLEVWSPITLRCDGIEHFPPNGDLGDGLLMGMWAGAAHQKSAAATIIHPYMLDAAPLGAFFGSWLMIDKYAQRLGSEVPVEPFITDLKMNAPDRKAWSIWDSNWENWIRIQQPAASEAIIATEGPKFDQAVEDGKLFKADTLEDLAAQLGVDAEKLQETVDKFNACYEAKEDITFGVPERFLSTVEEGPFYASEVVAGNGTTIFGLNVDKNSQVCTDADQPIPGLFAVGNVQGNFFNYTYPVFSPGISHGRAATFGNLVGHALAQGCTIYDVEKA